MKYSRPARFFRAGFLLYYKNRCFFCTGSFAGFHAYYRFCLDGFCIAFPTSDIDPQQYFPHHNSLIKFELPLVLLKFQTYWIHILFTQVNIHPTEVNFTTFFLENPVL